MDRVTKHSGDPSSTSSIALQEAQKLVQGLPEGSPSFTKLMKSTHVSGSFWLVWSSALAHIFIFFFFLLLQLMYLVRFFHMNKAYLSCDRAFLQTFVKDICQSAIKRLI